MFTPDYSVFNMLLTYCPSHPTLMPLDVSFGLIYFLIQCLRVNNSLHDNSSVAHLLQKLHDVLFFCYFLLCLVGHFSKSHPRCYFNITVTETICSSPSAFLWCQGTISPVLTHLLHVFPHL